MFDKGMSLAIGAASALGFSHDPGRFLNLDRERRYTHREPRRYTGVGYATEDLSARPTPPLAPDKPLTKRQKRRLRKKK